MFDLISFSILFSMTIFVQVDDDYKEVQLVLVESEMDLPKLDRITCGLSFSGCALTDKIYLVYSFNNLWHEIKHHMRTGHYP